MALLLCISIVLGLVAVVFTLQGLFVRLQNEADLLDFDTIAFVTSIVLSILIIIVDSIFERTVISLNDFENHRTQTEYEDNLIRKFFVVKIFNSYSALFYVAFIKQFISNQVCYRGNCFNDLVETLRVMFLVDLFARAFNEVILRIVRFLIVS